MKPTKEQLAKIFFTLTDHLESTGINLSAAAKAINLKTSTAHTWRRRGSVPSVDYINKLLLTFPTQLTTKAQELGIEVPRAKMKISEQERTAQLLREAQRLLAEVEKDKDACEKENARLRKQVDTLIAALAKSSK